MEEVILEIIVYFVFLKVIVDLIKLLNYEFVILQLRSGFERYPVIFLPTHRSYVDFLLLSYVCFTYSLPLPIIAAGMGK